MIHILVERDDVVERRHQKEQFAFRAKGCQRCVIGRFQFSAQVFRCEGTRESDAEINVIPGEDDKNRRKNLSAVLGVEICDAGASDHVKGQTLLYLLHETLVRHLHIAEDKPAAVFPQRPVPVDLIEQFADSDFGVIHFVSDRNY